MILYFANREMQILGQASGTLPCGFVILDDLKSEDVDTGVATFECKIGFDKENRLTLEAMTNSGNYLLRSHDNENEFYTIIDTEIDTKNQEVYIYAEDAGLDLLNEVVGAYEAAESHTAEWYINKYTNDSGFEIGINEIPATSTRKLSWDGEATVTERLASIATQFGGYEISFSFAINGMEVSNKYINIYKERGKELEEPLMLNRDIDRIITKKSVANLATAFLCTGGIPKGKDKPITLEGYEYDDGDFYVKGKYVMSREAVKKWSRYVWNKEPNQQTGYVGHIVRRYTYDTTSQQTLCSHAITELKKICDMEVNYEVDINRLPDTVRIGDRVNIVDDAGELYLSARILQLDTSIVNGSYKATLGEYLIKDSGISQKVEDLAAQFAELAANRTFYTWIAYADDETGAGISLDPAGKEYMGTAPNQTVEEVDISDPTVFSWSKIKGEQGPQGEQGIPGTDGSNGKTSYLHIAYANSSDGSSGFSVSDSTDKLYIGQYTDFTAADSTDYTKYSWSKIKGDTGRGTQNVTRYYILQSSTAAAPSKPTTNPPPSGWTDTEPTYTSGSTNSLYFCDLMVFSDGTWAYSEVSKSSSYEAAKEAYNKAVAAAKTATNFLSYDSTDGLLIGNKTSGEWSGCRSQILPTAFNILDAGGNILSSFGANLIELGKNNDSATINLCNGTAELKNTNDVANTNYKRLGIKSANEVGIDSENFAVNAFYEDRSDLNNVTENSVTIEAFTHLPWNEESDPFFTGATAFKILSDAWNVNKNEHMQASIELDGSNGLARIGSSYAGNHATLTVVGMQDLVDIDGKLNASGDINTAGNISAANLTQKSVTISGLPSDAGYTCYYYPVLKMCFLRLYYTGKAISATTATTLGTVASGYGPSSIHSLSVYKSQSPTKDMEAQINSSGQIRLYSEVAKVSTDDMYITGFWFV